MGTIAIFWRATIDLQPVSLHCIHCHNGIYNKLIVRNVSQRFEIIVVALELQSDQAEFEIFKLLSEKRA